MDRASWLLPAGRLHTKFGQKRTITFAAMSISRNQKAGLKRRDFLKLSAVTASALGASSAGVAARGPGKPGGGEAPFRARRDAKYNEVYAGERLRRVAFPMGGIGAGMICLEGAGALSHFSLRNHPDIFNEPVTFAAVCVKGDPNIVRVLEGPAPDW